MAGNLVSYLMTFLTPDTVARIATALGLDSDKAQRGVAAAVPAILAGLAGVASQPGGAGKIADAARQQSGVLDNLGSLLSGDSSATLAQSGSQLLASLLGGNAGALAGAVGSYTGLGQNAGGSLLGMLAPLVIGGVAKKLGADVSPDSISALFDREKDNIAAAMPAGLKGLLGGTGLLGGLGSSAAASGSDAAARAAASARSAAHDTAATATAATRSNWLYWLLGALALLVVFYYLFGRPAEQAVEQTAPAPETETAPEAPSDTAEPAAPAETPAAPETQTQTQPATPAAPSLEVGGVDLGAQVSDAIASLEGTLNGVTDAASAQAAAPQLQMAIESIDGVSGMLGQLSEEQKAALSAMVKPGITSLDALFDKVLAIPGVSDVLKPTIDAIRAKLGALAP